MDGKLAEFGKKRNTDYDFLSHYMWAENNKSYKQLSKIVFLRFQQFLNHELWIQRKSIPEQQIMENSDKIGHFDLYGPRKYLKNTYARKIFL